MIKTWGFLRTTTDSLGTQAQAVLTAKQHLEAFELDVDTQRAAWTKAAAALKQENADLQQQLADRQGGTTDYAGMRAALQLQISQAKAEVAAQAMEADKTLAVWQVHKQTYQQSIADLERTQTQVQSALATKNEHAVEEQKAVEIKQTELEAQIVSLKQQIAEQKDTNATEGVEASQNETSIKEQTTVLEQQFAEVKHDLAEVTAQAGKAGGLKEDLAAGQHDLALAQEHKLQTTAACQAKTAELKAVLLAEQQKVRLVQLQAARCDSASAHRDFVKGQVAVHCAR